MIYVDKRLLKAAANAGNKLPLGVGDDIKAIYIKYEAKMNEKYNKLRYHFSFKLADGEVKEIATSSGKILKKMSRVAPGSVLMITKLGEQKDTDYDFDIIKAPKTAAPVEDDIPTVQVEEEDEDDEEEEEEDDEEEEEDDSGPIKAKF